MWIWMDCWGCWWPLFGLLGLEFKEIVNLENGYARQRFRLGELMRVACSTYIEGMKDGRMLELMLNVE